LVVEWFAKCNTMCYFPEGWSAFWKKVTAHLDVRTGSDITEIKRLRNGKVSIMVNGKLELFDVLIVTSPLPVLHEFLDLSAKERALFSGVKNYRLVSSLVEASKHLKTSFCLDNTKRDRIGHVIGFEDYHPETSCYVTFQIVPHDMSPEKIRKLMVADARGFGSNVRHVVTQKAWNYFYHVPTEE